MCLDQGVSASIGTDDYVSTDKQLHALVKTNCAKKHVVLSLSLVPSGRRDGALSYALAQHKHRCSVLQPCCTGACLQRVRRQWRGAEVTARPQDPHHGDAPAPPYLPHQSTHTQAKARGRTHVQQANSCRARGCQPAVVLHLIATKGEGRLHQKTCNAATIAWYHPGLSMLCLPGLWRPARSELLQACPSRHSPQPAAVSVLVAHAGPWQLWSYPHPARAPHMLYAFVCSLLFDCRRTRPSKPPPLPHVSRKQPPPPPPPRTTRALKAGPADPFLPLVSHSGSRQLAPGASLYAPTTALLLLTGLCASSRALAPRKRALLANPAARPACIWCTTGQGKMKTHIAQAVAVQGRPKFTCITATHAYTHGVVRAHVCVCARAHTCSRAGGPHQLKH